MKEKIEINEEVQKLIMSFSDPNLTEEEEEICLHIWKKLTRKRKLDITRTRSDIWAAAIIWCFCRANFKYEEGITLELVCSFFKRKKSTVGNKAGEIIKILKIDYFSPEFSNRYIRAQNPADLPMLVIANDFEIPEEVNESMVRETDQCFGSKRRKAEQTLEEGLDRLEQGDEEEAGQYFFESIEIDPTYADGYNHMANIVWRKGDWKQAEGLYQKALAYSEPEIKNIPRGRFWGMLESRPYMRALHGLGLTLWKQGRLEEAIVIFNRMLKLNVNDNQGIRYLMGPLHHQKGELDKAIVWYVQNLDEPDNRFNYGLALIQQKQLEPAAAQLIIGLFENPYIVPGLLNEKLPERDWWHGSSLAEPEYAEDYVKEHRNWLKNNETALMLLRAIWTHGEVQRTINDYIAIRTAMRETRVGDLGLASRRLIGDKKIKRLAHKIYEGLAQDRAGQMELKWDTSG